MGKIITQTDDVTLSINTENGITIQIEEGKYRMNGRKRITLSDRQVNKLIEELKSALANCC